MKEFNYASKFGILLSAFTSDYGFSTNKRRSQVFFLELHEKIILNGVG